MEDPLLYTYRALGVVGQQREIENAQLRNQISEMEKLLGSEQAAHANAAAVPGRIIEALTAEADGATKANAATLEGAIEIVRGLMPPPPTPDGAEAATEAAADDSQVPSADGEGQAPPGS